MTNMIIKKKHIIQITYTKSTIHINEENENIRKKELISIIELICFFVRRSTVLLFITNDNTD